MSEIIFFLLGALTLAACEWLYLKKFHQIDAFKDAPEKLVESTATTSPASATSDEPQTDAKISPTIATAKTSATVAAVAAVSKGRAFLDRMGSKESKTPSVTSPSAESTENTSATGAAVSKGRAFLDRMGSKESKASSASPATAAGFESTEKNTAAVGTVSKGRAFLGRMASKESKAPAATSPKIVGGSSNISDKSSIKTTRAMAKEKSAVTSSSVEKSPVNRTGSVAADDLQKVSGVGPKIAELLNAAGISTYSDLAETNPAKLSAIMVKAGPRYSLADVSIWAEQAKMLANGDTEALSMLQDSLKNA